MTRTQSAAPAAPAKCPPWCERGDHDDYLRCVHQALIGRVNASGSDHVAVRLAQSPEAARGSVTVHFHNQTATDDGSRMMWLNALDAAGFMRRDGHPRPPRHRRARP